MSIIRFRVILHINGKDRFIVYQDTVSCRKEEELRLTSWLKSSPLMELRDGKSLSDLQAMSFHRIICNKWDERLEQDILIIVGKSYWTKDIYISDNTNKEKSAERFLCSISEVTGRQSNRKECIPVVADFSWAETKDITILSNTTWITFGISDKLFTGSLDV